MNYLATEFCPEAEFCISNALGNLTKGLMVNSLGCVS